MPGLAAVAHPPNGVGKDRIWRPPLRWLARLKPSPIWGVSKLGECIKMVGWEVAIRLGEVTMRSEPLSTLEKAQTVLRNAGAIFALVMFGCTTVTLLVIATI